MYDPQNHGTYHQKKKSWNAPKILFHFLVVLGEDYVSFFFGFFAGKFRQAFPKETAAPYFAVFVSESI